MGPSQAVGDASTGASKTGPMVHVSRFRKYAPGDVIVTILHSKTEGKVAQHWSVGADGVHLTAQGDHVLATPELIAQAKADHSKGVAISPHDKPEHGKAEHESVRPHPMTIPAAVPGGSSAAQSLSTALSTAQQVASTAAPLVKQLPAMVSSISSMFGEAVVEGVDVGLLPRARRARERDGELVWYAERAGIDGNSVPLGSIEDPVGVLPEVAAEPMARVPRVADRLRRAWTFSTGIAGSMPEPALAIGLAHAWVRSGVADPQLGSWLAGAEFSGNLMGTEEPDGALVVYKTVIDSQGRRWEPGEVAAWDYLRGVKLSGALDALAQGDLTGYAAAMGEDPAAIASHLPVIAMVLDREEGAGPIGIGAVLSRRMSFAIAAAIGTVLGTLTGVAIWRKLASEASVTVRPGLTLVSDPSVFNPEKISKLVVDTAKTAVLPKPHAPGKTPAPGSKPASTPGLPKVVDTAIKDPAGTLTSAIKDPAGTLTSVLQSLPVSVPVPAPASQGRPGGGSPGGGGASLDATLQATLPRLLGSAAPWSPGLLEDDLDLEDGFVLGEAEERASLAGAFAFVTASLLSFAAGGAAGAVLMTKAGLTALKKASLPAFESLEKAGIVPWTPDEGKPPHGALPAGDEVADMVGAKLVEAANRAGVSFYRRPFGEPGDFARHEGGRGRGGAGGGRHGGGHHMRGVGESSEAPLPEEVEIAALAPASETMPQVEGFGGEVLAGVLVVALIELGALALHAKHLPRMLEKEGLELVRSGAEPKPGFAIVSEDFKPLRDVFVRAFGDRQGPWLLQLVASRGWRYQLASNRTAGGTSKAGATPAAPTVAGASDDEEGPRAPIEVPAAGPSSEAPSSLLSIGGSFRTKFGLHFRNGFLDATFFKISFPGLCGGMCLTSLDYYYANELAPATTDTPSMDSELGNYIRERQIDSVFGKNGARFLELVFNPSDASLASSTAKDFDIAKKLLERATAPIVLGMIPSPWSPLQITRAHQVLALRCEVTADGSKVVYIWDPNWPSDATTKLVQAKGERLWVESGDRASGRWRGFFLETGYEPKVPPGSTSSLSGAASPRGESRMAAARAQALLACADPIGARASVVIAPGEDGLFAAIRSVKHGGKAVLPGGSVEPDESFEDAGRRELEEETGLVADELVPMGRCLVMGRVCALFVAPSWRGTLRSSPEGEAFWATRQELADFPRSWLGAADPNVLNSDRIMKDPKAAYALIEERWHQLLGWLGSSPNVPEIHSQKESWEAFKKIWQEHEGFFFKEHDDDADGLRGQANDLAIAESNALRHGYVVPKLSVDSSNFVSREDAGHATGAQSPGPTSPSDAAHSKVTTVVRPPSTPSAEVIHPVLTAIPQPSLPVIPTLPGVPGLPGAGTQAKLVAAGVASGVALMMVTALVMKLGDAGADRYAEELLRLREARRRGSQEGPDGLVVTPEEDAAVRAILAGSYREDLSLGELGGTGLNWISVLASMLAGAGIAAIGTGYVLARELGRKLYEKGIWIMMPGDELAPDHGYVDPADVDVRYAFNGPCEAVRELFAKKGWRFQRLAAPDALATLPSAAPSPSEDALTVDPGVEQYASISGIPALGYGQAERAEPGVVTAHGSGEARVSPDVAWVSLGVEVQEPKLETARHGAAMRAESILGALRGLGIAGLTLETSRIDFRPVYASDHADRGLSFRQGLPEVVGYAADSGVLARLRGAPAGELAKRASKVVDAAMGAGANRVDRVGFGLERPELAARAALALAVEDARANAEALARTGRVTLGQLHSLNEDEHGHFGGGIEAMSVGSRGMSSMSTETPVEAGDIVVRRGVVARWRFGGSPKTMVPSHVGVALGAVDMGFWTYFSVVDGHKALLRERVKGQDVIAVDGELVESASAGASKDLSIFREKNGVTVVVRAGIGAAAAGPSIGRGGGGGGHGGGGRGGGGRGRRGSYFPGGGWGGWGYLSDDCLCCDNDVYGGDVCPLCGAPWFGLGVAAVARLGNAQAVGAYVGALLDLREDRAASLGAYVETPRPFDVGACPPLSRCEVSDGEHAAVLEELGSRGWALVGVDRAGALPLHLARVSAMDPAAHNVRVGETMSVGIGQSSMTLRSMREVGVAQHGDKATGVLVGRVRDGEQEPIQWVDVPGPDGMTVTVASDDLRATTPWSSGKALRLPTSWPETVAIARSLSAQLGEGVIVASQRLADALYAAAPVKTAFHSQVTASDPDSGGWKMHSADATLKYNADVDAQVAGRSGLVAGHQKHWLLHPRLAETVKATGKPAAVNYGAWTSAGKVQQSPGAMHDVDYGGDTSQLFRAVKRFAKAGDGSVVYLLEWMERAESVPRRFTDLFRFNDGVSSPSSSDSLVATSASSSSTVPARASKPVSSPAHASSSQRIAVTAKPSPKPRALPGPAPWEVKSGMDAVDALRPAEDVDALAMRDAADEKLRRDAAIDDQILSATAGVGSTEELGLTEDEVGQDAGLAIAAAAAVCTVVPGVGTAACAAGAAIASVFVAIGVAVSAGLRDTYRLDTATAAGQLAIIQTLPSALFAGYDTLTVEGFHNGANFIHPRTGTPAADACRSVRYDLLVAGICKAPGAPLYNPGDRDSRSNPFMESGTPVPTWPLTDVRVTQKIINTLKANHNDLNAAAIQPMPKTKEDAAALLAVLRSPHFADSGIMSWDPTKSVLPGLRRNAGRLKALAGERGHDAILSQLFGGPVVAAGPAHRKLGAAPPW